MIGSNLPHRPVGREAGRSIDNIFLFLCVMMCLFQHFHIQHGQLNQNQLGRLFKSNVLDSGLDGRDLSHKSYRSVSIAASFIKFNGLTDFRTYAVVKQLHLATVMIPILKAQHYSADYN